MARINKSVRTFWARLSTSYYRDEKILSVGPLGEVAFIRLLALSREYVETVEINGGIPEIVVYRELRDVGDEWVKINDSKTGVKDILELLASKGLITFMEDLIVVRAYDKWQTSREEIQEVREDTRVRQAERRQRQRVAQGESLEELESYENLEEVKNDSVAEGKTKSGRIKSKKDKEAEMGIYDDKVEAFTDLRKDGGVSKGKKKIGLHGLDPALVESAQKVVSHLEAVRKAKIGEGFRITDTWWSDTQKLLKGTSDFPGFSADALCDLIDFALADRFWHVHTTTPAGLVKHGFKLYTGNDYVAWSKRNDRPEANRPRNELVGSDKPVKGALAADKKVDWEKQSEKL